MWKGCQDETQFLGFVKDETAGKSHCWILLLLVCECGVIMCVCMTEEMNWSVLDKVMQAQQM